MSMTAKRIAVGVTLVVLCASKIPFLPAILIAIIGVPFIEALLTPRPHK